MAVELESNLLHGHWQKVKCEWFRAGFKLEWLNPFPKTITLTPNVCVCVCSRVHALGVKKKGKNIFIDFPNVFLTFTN